jgi:hypothetical protein
VEPIIHGLPIVFGLGFALPPLFLELYNPTTTFFPWCGFWVYPSECLNDENQECIRGDRDIMVAALYLFFVAVPLNFLIIVIALVAVVVKVIKTDRTLNTISPVHRDTGNMEIQDLRLNNGRTKAVLVQSFSYILSFLLAFTIPMLNALDHLLSVRDSTHRSDVGGAQVTIDKLSIFLFPLQGFFNFIIFLSFKVYNYRRICKEDSIPSILIRLFFSSDHDPAFITRMSMVHVSEKNGEVHSSSEEDMSDEVMDDDCQFRIGLMLTNNANVDDVDDLEEAESQDAHGQNDEVSLRLKFDINDPRLNALAGRKLPKIDEDASMSNFESVPSVTCGSTSSGYHYYGTCFEKKTKN